MDTREWIFVLGVIIVVIIALVLAARWRRQRFDDIQHGSHLHGDTDDEDFPTDELPGGGARTVGFRDPTDIVRMNDEIRERAEASKPRLSSFRPEPVVQPSLLDNDLDEDEFEHEDYDPQEESVPLLLDPSDEHNAEDLPESDTEQDQATDADEPEMTDEPRFEKPAADSSEHSRKAHLQELEDLADDLKDEEPELELTVEPDDQPARIKAERSKTDRQEQNHQAAAAKASRSSESTQAGQREGQDKGATVQQDAPPEIIIINLMTEPSEPYEGVTLVKLAQELGLRFGDMDIFHYCGRHGDEAPQFRMANLLKPGYFDIHNMDRTRTHALCFFFELMPDQDNMKVYESMLSVINKLRDDLGGELHDENRSVFTIQTSEHCRNRIRDYQRRHLLAR